MDNRFIQDRLQKDSANRWFIYSFEDGSIECAWRSIGKVCIDIQFNILDNISINLWEKNLWTTYETYYFRRWKIEMENSKKHKRKASLLRAIFRTFWWEYTVLGLMQILNEFIIRYIFLFFNSILCIRYFHNSCTIII